MTAKTPKLALTRQAPTDISLQLSTSDIYEHFRMPALNKASFKKYSEIHIFKYIWLPKTVLQMDSLRIICRVYGEMSVNNYQLVQ